MKRDLAGKVVVITGASSGIGRAAARRFAERGARLVLAARRATELDEVAAICERLGAHAIAVPTDVTDPAAVEALAARAIAEFGAIDVWCNNAGVYMMGELGDVPIDVHQRIVSVNLLDLSSPEFFKGVRQFYQFKDVWFGLVKSSSFGCAIALMGALTGLRTQGGAEGVGHATTRAVVLGCEAILVLDAFWALVLL